MIMFRSSVQLKNSPIKYGKLKNIYQGENQAYLDKSHKYIYINCFYRLSFLLPLA